MAKDPFAELGFQPINNTGSQADGDSFASLGFQEESVPKPKAFRYDVAEPTLGAPVDRQAKIKQYQAEADVAAKEAKKANSVGGFLANAGKAFVKNIAGSEVGLGETIAKELTDPTVYADANQKLNDTNVTLQRLIKNREAKGLDASALKRSYNSNVSLIEENENAIDKYNKELPSTSKVVGQLGGTALDILSAGTYGKAKTAGMVTGKLAPKTSTLATKVATGSGLPELGKVIENKATGLFTKKGALNVAKGAGLGYTSDVTQGLQGNRGEDRTGGKAFIPGLGTAIGTGLPVITEGIQSIKNITDPTLKVNKIIEKRATALQKIEDNNSSVRNYIGKQTGKGVDVKKILAETDLLHDAVDNTGTIRTKNAIADLNEFIKPQEDVISANLQKEGAKVPLKLVEKQMKASIEASGMKGAAKINAFKKVADEIEGLALDSDKDGWIPLSTLHDAKVDKYSNINFLGDPAVKKADRAIAKTLKEVVEKNTKSVNVQQLNKELSAHYATQGFLEKLDGKKVEGGKLGKYFAQTVGAIVGSHFGPLGSIVGAEVGSGLKGAQMSGALNGKTGKILESSEAMKSAIEKGKPNPAIPLPAAGQSLNNLGSRQTAQTTTMIPTMTGISETIPQNLPSNNFIKTNIDSHLSSAQQILDNMPPELIEKNGGIPNLLQRTKINIVDQLNGIGSSALAEKINKVDPASFSSLDDFAKVVRTIANNVQGGNATIGTIIGAGAAGLGGLAAFGARKPEVVPEPTPEAPKQYSIPDRGVVVSADDFSEFAPIAFGEVSNRSPEKMELEIRTILNTALNRMREYATKGQEKTLAEVLKMNNQFQAFGGKQYNEYSKPNLDAPTETKRQQVNEILNKLFSEIENGTFADNTQGAFYYKHRPNNTIVFDNNRPLFK